MGGEDYEAGMDLDGAIEREIGYFEQEREAYLTRNPENEFHRVVEATAAMLLRGATRLTTPNGQAGDLLSWDAARLVADHEYFADEVLEGIQIAVAWEYAAGTAEKARRCATLARLAIAGAPREAVLRFLARISRCYVLGFNAECVVMCRAALENGVKERFDRQRIPLPATPEGKSSMGTRLAAARRFGWLSDRAEADASSLWKRGSKVVHDDPDLVADPLPSIQATMQVLAELYSDGNAA
jgi:hypothetical protein